MLPSAVWVAGVYPWRVPLLVTGQRGGVADAELRGCVCTRGEGKPVAEGAPELNKSTDVLSSVDTLDGVAEVMVALVRYGAWVERWLKGLSVTTLELLALTSP